jgi:hypothetical protein
VCAYNSYGSSVYTATASATTFAALAPTVSLTAPTNYSIVSGPITVSTSASDNSGAGLARIDLYRDDTNIIWTASQSPATCTDDTTKLSNGAHTYSVIAVDACNNSSTAYSTVTVNNSTQPAGPWVKSFGSTGTDGGSAVAVDSAGNIYLAGYFSGTINLGSGSLTSVGSQNMVLAKYSAAGVLQWAERIGLGSEQAAGLALDPSGNILVVGIFSGTTDLSGATSGGGSTSLTSAGGNDVFLAKYSNSGAYLWSKRIGSVLGDGAGGVAVDSGGNVIITGTFQGPVDFGGGVIYPYGFDTFLVKYSGTGQYTWARTGNASNNATPGGVAVDSGDNIVLGGKFVGSINFGGGALTSISTMASSAYLVKFAATGAYVWARVYGETYGVTVAGVAVDSNGNIYMTGEFYGSVDLGSGTLTVYGGYGNNPYLAKYAADSTPQWSMALTGPGSYVYSTAVAADSSGNVWVTGYFTSTLNVGGGVTLTSAGGQSMFVGKYSSSGAYLWSQSFGGPLYTYAGCAGLAIDGSGYMVGTGYFSGTANFNVQSLTSIGGYDGFLVRTSP